MEASAAEVERLVGLGARHVEWRYPEDADYIVLADPDGNTCTRVRMRHQVKLVTSGFVLWQTPTIHGDAGH